MAIPRGSNSGSSKKTRSSKKSNDSNQTVLGILVGGGIAVVMGLIAFFIMGRGGEGEGVSNAPIAPNSNAAVNTGVTPTSVTTPITPVSTVPMTLAQGSSLAPAASPTLSPAVPTSLPTPLANAPAVAESSVPLSMTPATFPSAERPKPVVLSYPDLVEKTDMSIVRLNVTSSKGQSVGSGFVVSDTGIVITNYHVIEGGKTVKVQFEDNRECDVTGFKLLDHERDIAIIQLDSKGQPFIPISLARELPRKGEEVAAFGAPLGLSFTASKGTVSNVRNGKELRMKGTYIQTDTPISPGNSGGPLVSMSGEVIGMNTFQLSIGQNLNFAISVDDIREVLAASESKSIEPITPASVPEQQRGPDAADPESRPGLVDITGTERADKLLAQMKESFVIVKPFEIDPSGRINEFMIDKLKKTIKSRLKMELTRINKLPDDQPVIVMGVMFDIPEDEKLQERLASELSLEIYVIMLDLDKDGNRVPSIVWREKSKLANLSIKALAQGNLTNNVKDGAQEFFNKFATNVIKARKAHGGGDNN